MTEIEEKAKNYIKELAKEKIPFNYKNANECIEKAYADGYTAGLYDKHADREEDIKHLSKQNADLEQQFNDAAELCNQQAQKITELQQKNDADEMALQEAGEIIAELKAKFEKLEGFVSKLNTMTCNLTLEAFGMEAIQMLGQWESEKIKTK